MKGYGRPTGIIPLLPRPGIIRRNETHLLHIWRFSREKHVPNVSQIQQDFRSSQGTFRGFIMVTCIILGIVCRTLCTHEIVPLITISVGTFSISLLAFVGTFHSKNSLIRLVNNFNIYLERNFWKLMGYRSFSS